MNVQHKDCDDYRAGNENHGEQKILADEWRGQRRGRVDLRDQQQEDVERIEDCDTHSYLLSGVCWNVENKKCDRTNSYTWKYEVDCIEQSFSSDCDVELDVWIRFRTAWIMFVVLFRLDSQQIPLRALVIVVQIDA